MVSAAIESLIRRLLRIGGAARTAGQGHRGPVEHYRVIAERASVTRTHAWTAGRSGPRTGATRASWSEASGGRAGPRRAGVHAVKPESARAAWPVRRSGCAQQAGAVVLELAGSPFHTDVGLHPIRGLIERRCGIDARRRPQERLRQLSRTTCVSGSSPRTPWCRSWRRYSAFRRKPGMRTAQRRRSTPVGPDRRRRAGLLFACAGDGPALLLAEDMHWFDEDTVDVVDRLLGARRGRLLVVMTSRERSSLPRRPSTPRSWSSSRSPTRESDELIIALHPSHDTGRAKSRAAPLRRRTAVHRRGGGQARGSAARRCRNRHKCPTPSTRHCSRACDPAATPYSSWRRRPSSAARWIGACSSGGRVERATTSTR